MSPMCTCVYLRLGILHPLMFCHRREGSRFWDWPRRATFTAGPRGPSWGVGLVSPGHCWGAFSHNHMRWGGLEVVQQLQVRPVTWNSVHQTQVSVDSADTPSSKVENYILLTLFPTIVVVVAVFIHLFIFCTHTCLSDPAGSIIIIIIITSTIIKTTIHKVTLYNSLKIIIYKDVILQFNLEQNYTAYCFLSLALPLSISPSVHI